jgi:hypothetical protein
MPGLEKKKSDSLGKSSLPSAIRQLFSHQGRLFGTDASFFSAGHVVSLGVVCRWPSGCARVLAARERRGNSDEFRYEGVIFSDDR